MSRKLKRATGVGWLGGWEVGGLGDWGVGEQLGRKENCRSAEELG
jgi:hypothetical protein